MGGRRHPVICGSSSVAPTRVLQESQKGFCLADDDELCLPLARALQLEELGTMWTGKPLSYKAHQRQKLEGRSLLPPRKQGAMVNPTVLSHGAPNECALALMQRTLLENLGTDSALLRSGSSGGTLHRDTCSTRISFLAPGPTSEMNC